MTEGIWWTRHVAAFFVNRAPQVVMHLRGGGVLGALSRKSASSAKNRALPDARLRS